MNGELGNIDVTNIEDQGLILKNKVSRFFNRSMRKRKSEGFCITKDVLSTVMDKWSLFVIYNLAYYGTLRFGELKTNIRKISSRMLSVTLKKLEEHKLITRQVHAEVPPRVEYRLTEFGAALAERTVELNDWLLEEYLQDEEK